MVAELTVYPSIERWGIVGLTNGTHLSAAPCGPLCSVRKNLATLEIDSIIF
jgi:hypothetical protein